MTFANFQITPVSGALGAEVAGVDLSKNLDDDSISEIRAALLQYLVLFFRDQKISPQQHLDFARRFGELVDYPLVRGLEDYPDIVPVVKLEHERHNFGGLWHSEPQARPPSAKAEKTV